MITLSSIQRVPSPNARQKTLDAVASYQKAQERLEQICKEKGIQVPQLVC